MDKRFFLIKVLSRIYWRELKDVKERKIDILFLFLVMYLVAFRLLPFLQHAEEEMARGRLVDYTMVVTFVAVGWMFVSSISNTFGFVSKLSHLPLSCFDEYSLSAMSIFIKPTTWILSLVTVLTIYPLRNINPLPVVVLLYLLFIAASISTGMTLSFLREVVLSCKISTLIFTGAVVMSAFVLLPRVDMIPFALSILQRAPSAELCKRFVAPNKAASVCLWTFVNVAGVLVSYFSCFLARKRSRVRQQRSSPLVPSVRILGKYSEIYQKGCREMCRCIEPWIGLALSIQFFCYAIYAQRPTSTAAFVCLLLVFSFVYGIFLNYFSTESRRSIDRYRLFPLSGDELLGAKNGVVCISILLVVSPVILGSLRLGLLPLLCVAETTFTMIFLFFIWGNSVSIRYPLGSKPFRWIPIQMTGTTLTQVVIFVICCAPVFISIAGLRFLPAHAVLLCSCPILLGSWVLYRTLRRKAGARFSQYLSQDHHFDGLNE